MTKRKSGTSLFILFFINTIILTACASTGTNSPAEEPVLYSVTAKNDKSVLGDYITYTFLLANETTEEGEQKAHFKVMDYGHKAYYFYECSWEGKEYPFLIFALVMEKDQLCVFTPTGTNRMFRDNGTFRQWDSVLLKQDMIELLKTTSTLRVMHNLSVDIPAEGIKALHSFLENPSEYRIPEPVFG